MTILLPPKIEAYFNASNAERADDLAATFAADGEVRDEGETHRGRSAIAAWALGNQKRYRMQSEPLTVTDARQAQVVTAMVTGDFPGSPLELTFSFSLGDDGIRALEIGA